MEMKWFALMVVGLFAMVAVGIWAENKSEANKIEACGKIAVELQKDCLDKIQ